MEKRTSKRTALQHWLSFSAFTLAGAAFEGTVPPVQAVPKAKKWRQAE
ncbi:hypothetical protein O3W44_18525 [Pantoea sp. LMR881]|nr:hypothetical protein [Pantoea sp. LMR881]MCZ4060672.1 hypothetical protein [Pantoea sp. LMR881]